MIVIAVDTLVRTWTLLFPRAVGEQQRPNQSGDRYTKFLNSLENSIRSNSLIAMPLNTTALVEVSAR